MIVIVKRHARKMIC